MTRSTPDEDPAELTRAVHELAGMVDRQSTVLEALAVETRSNTTQTDINTTQTDANTAQSKRNTSSNKRHAIALWITAISLLADVVITFVLFHYQAQQDCLSSLRQAHFNNYDPSSFGWRIEPDLVPFTLGGRQLRPLRP
jgi:hypothetical protein